MPKRKAFLLRMDPRILEALQHWADDELRSLNGQIEYVLRDALRRTGRVKEAADRSPDEPAPGASPTDSEDDAEPPKANE